MHLLTRIAQNSNEILAEFANQNTEHGGFILDLIHPCGYSDADGTFLLNSERKKKVQKYTVSTNLQQKIKVDNLRLIVLVCGQNVVILPFEGGSSCVQN